MRYSRYFWIILPPMLWIGCNSPAHQERLAYRQRTYERSKAMIEEIDEDREAKLQWFLNWMEQEHRQDEQDWQRAKRDFRKYWAEDRNRANYYGPRNDRLIEELSASNPDNIERTLPWILY